MATVYSSMPLILEDPLPPPLPPHHHHHSVSYSERAIKSVCVCICICQKSALIFTITVLPLSPVPYLFSFWHQALFSSILHQVVPKAGLHFPFIFFPHITLIWHGKKITSVFFFFFVETLWNYLIIYGAARYLLRQCIWKHVLALR